MVPLGRVAAINPRVGGSTATNGAEEVAFLPMDAISEGGFVAYQQRRRISEVTNGYTCFKRGDILLAKITPCMENGKAAHLQALETESGFGSTEFHVIRPSDDLDGRYAFYLIWNPRFRHLAECRMTGSAGQKRVPASFLKELEIPLPPLAEQRRIAAILDKADALRHKHERALGLADDFLRSTFLHMFGDPVKNPKGLPKDTLGNVIKVSSGEGLTASRMDASGLYPVYGGNGITGRHSEYLFESSKIVLGRVGVYCGAVHVTEPRSWVTDNALYVKSIIRKDVDFVYLVWALRVANLNQYASQAAQPLISGGRIYPVDILIPDRQTQRRFADQIDRQNQLALTLQNAGQRATDLFSALSQSAFRGEL